MSSSIPPKLPGSAPPKLPGSAPPELPDKLDEKWLLEEDIEVTQLIPEIEEHEDPQNTASRLRLQVLSNNLKSLSSALLISRYILGLEQRGRCCFCAACPNRKMYLEIRSANEGA